MTTQEQLTSLDRRALRRRSRFPAAGDPHPDRYAAGQQRAARRGGGRHGRKASAGTPRSTRCRRRQVRDYGMESITNLIVRRPYGARRADHRAQRARRRGAAGRGLDQAAVWRRDRRRLSSTGARRRCRSAISPPTSSPCARWKRWACRSRAASNCTSPTTRNSAACSGPGWLLEQKLTKPDFVIAAGFSYNIVTAHNACLQLEITVHGKSGHGAMPETGHDALQAATRILNAIYGQLPELKKIKSKVPGIDSPTMLVGRIDGGTNTNVVPGKVVHENGPPHDSGRRPGGGGGAGEGADRGRGGGRAGHPRRDPAPAAVACAAAAAGAEQAGGEPAAATAAR